MISVSVLLSVIGVVAVAFECEVAALAFMGLAVALRVILRDGERAGTCGDTWGARKTRLLFHRIPFLEKTLRPISKCSSKPTAAARLHAAVPRLIDVRFRPHARNQSS
jgi:hypothetical protein